MHKEELINALNDLLSKEYHEADQSQIIQLYGLAFPQRDPLNPTCGSCIRDAFQKLKWSKSHNFSNLLIMARTVNNADGQIETPARKYSFAPAYKGKRISVPRLKIKQLTEDKLTDQIGEILFNDPLTKKYVIVNS